MRRVVFILVATAVAALSVADYLAWRSSQRRLIVLAEESGLTRRLPDFGRELRRKTVPGRAATFVAWSLLQLEVDRTWLAELPEAERAEEAGRGLGRLRLARRLAEETLPGRPASWQAATVLGAGHYLETARDRRTVPSPSSWREPLQAAMRLAPGYAEPPLLLASAYLSRWSSLSSGERGEALPVLARAFEEPRGRDLLLPLWVQLAPSLASLLEAIPDRAPVWQALGAQFSRRGDLERFGIAHRRWLDSMPDYLAGRLESARARRRSGYPRYGGLVESVIASPHDLTLVDNFVAAVAEMPATPVASRTYAHLDRWLTWALDLCVLERCPLGAETLALLAGRVADPAPAELALAAIAGDDKAAARRHEAAAGEGDDPGWNRYWIFKAGRLAASDPGQARRALASASPVESDRLRYWRAAERLAEVGGDGMELRRARDELARLTPTVWSADDWSGRGRQLRLELLAATPADGVRLTVAGIRPEGAAVELRWNGRALGVAALRSGESHRWLLPIEPGLHLAEVENLTGPPPRPVAFSLEFVSPAG